MSQQIEQPLYISLKHGPIYVSSLEAAGIPAKENPYKEGGKSMLATHLRQTVVSALKDFATILR